MSTDLQAVARWLAETQYVVDWHTAVPPPQPLWDAFVDVVHADEHETWHGHTLTREEVDDWLRSEAGYQPAPEPVSCPALGGAHVWRLGECAGCGRPRPRPVGQGEP